MIENRVNKISDDRWKQFHDESVKLHMNEVAMEYRYEAEEAKKLAEKEKQNALDEKKKVNQAREQITILIHTLSETMSKEDIAELLNISIDELNAY